MTVIPIYGVFDDFSFSTKDSIEVISVGMERSNRIGLTILLFTLFDLDLDDVVRVALWLKLSLPGGKNISGSMLFTYITEFKFSLNIFIALVKHGVGPQVFPTLVTALPLQCTYKT